jgi:histidinol-phosphate aminotransferase
MTKALPHIIHMSPYALADMAAPNGTELVSLCQNECLRGPSPMAVAAANQSLTNAADYPDPDWTDLRHGLGDLHGIAADKILCGNGSLDLIGCLARTYAGPDRAVLIPAHAYPFFRTAAQMAQARVDIAPEREATVNVDALLEAVQPDTGMVCVANPGNPTGTRIAKPELIRLRAGLRDDIMLVIDEAYGEFADHLNEPCWDMIDSGNCVVLRTFSKAYALAGFRIGWGLFPDQISAQLRKVMNPNGVSLVAQSAACAAVHDQQYMKETCAVTASLRDKAYLALCEAGFDVVPSITNFLLIHFQSENDAQSADETLQRAGIFLRRQQGAGLPQSLRMTIGPEPATQKAIAHLLRWKGTNTL